ncbi:PIG-P-domain-containing protein [Kockovaella imperatae]|uniref:PIG-P-domain-containing protein n=1 Tax=Kockovaella imperatae TaxID=4999 RepID=A0A1Y1U8Q4_9TREE|nr:PIG-P-domain-containing protein [Kockovaella imperatae]ORX33495.1 PIG-P-domain-containing protein [Kockovaella imperatae]
MSHRRSLRRRQQLCEATNGLPPAAEDRQSEVSNEHAPPLPIQTSTTSWSTSTSTSTSTIQNPPPAPTSPLSPISPWPPIDSGPSHRQRPHSKSIGPQAVRPDTSRVLESTDEPDHGEGEEGVQADREPAVPSAREVYGFVAVILTFLGYWLYIAWAFSPPNWLDSIGWTWYPDRQWAIVIPCWLMVVVLCTYLAYGGLTVYMTPSLDSPAFITDPYSNIPTRESPTDPPSDVYSRLVRGETTEAVDIPIDMVNRVLYSRRPDR